MKTYLSTPVYKERKPGFLGQPMFSLVFSIGEYVSPVQREEKTKRERET
jgi:hypothetical protein